MLLNVQLKVLLLVVQLPMDRSVTHDAERDIQELNITNA